LSQVKNSLFTSVQRISSPFTFDLSPSIKNIMATTQREHWLRGPVADVPVLLQPVAHALLQAKDEINEMMNNVAENLLWRKPGGAASPAFHLQHIPGVLDRLFSYAAGQMLSTEQLEYLKKEGVEDDNLSKDFLLKQLNDQIDKSIAQLKDFENDLISTRYVGRQQIPSNVLGLLFHSAEHTMRHTGQLLVTVKVLQSKEFKV
jgi:hypothetical protein